MNVALVDPDTGRNMFDENGKPMFVSGLSFFEELAKIAKDKFDEMFGKTLDTDAKLEGIREICEELFFLYG